MHPNAFLKTFWRLDLTPQIFVAMSFAEEYRGRYNEVVAPAISRISINGNILVPYRVDISKSGDSILTDIMDGIAHSQLILADVSSIGKDSKTGEPYRNGNVMYEVGLALACREPSEVLLVRDDKDKFLFDVSTVPHLEIDFTCIQSAQNALYTELVARLNEQKFVNDARVQLAVKSLSDQEIKVLAKFADLSEGEAQWFDFGGTVLSVYEAAIMRLLDKRLVILIGKSDKGFPSYQPTQLGKIVARIAKTKLPIFQERKDIPKDPDNEMPDNKTGKPT